MAYRINGGPLWQMLWLAAEDAMYDEWGCLESKKWGYTTTVRSCSAMGVHVAVNEAHETGESSSLHYHRRADNYFVMRDGCIRIDVPNNEPIFLTTDQVLCVPVSQHHRFTVIEPATFVEIYLAPPNSPMGEDDIIRIV